MTILPLRPNHAHDADDPLDAPNLDTRPAPNGQDTPPSDKAAGKNAHRSPGKSTRTRSRHNAHKPKGAPRRARRGAGGEVPDDMANLAARMHRAFELYCRGFRTAMIAEQLGVTTRTVRGYLDDYTDQIGAEHRIDRDKNLMRAIESQHTIAAAAWEAYERECTLQTEILAGQHDFVRRRLVRPGTPGRPRKAGQAAAERSASSHTTHEARHGAADTQDGDVLQEEIARPRLPSQGARYLATALAAQREIARLQRLYDAPPPEPTNIEITIVRRPDGPENIPPPLEQLDHDSDDPDAPDADPDAWAAPAAPPLHAPDPATRATSPAPASVTISSEGAASDRQSLHTADRAIPDAADDDADLIDPGDAVPTVTRRAADQPPGLPPAASTPRPAIPTSSLVTSRSARRGITRKASTYKTAGIHRSACHTITRADSSYGASPAVPDTIRGTSTLRLPLQLQPTSPCARPDATGNAPESCRGEACLARPSHDYSLAVHPSARPRITRRNSSYDASTTTPLATCHSAPFRGTPLPAGRGAGGEAPIPTETAPHPLSSSPSLPSASFVSSAVHLANPFRANAPAEAATAHEFSAKMTDVTAKSGKNGKRLRQPAELTTAEVPRYHDGRVASDAITRAAPSRHSAIQAGRRGRFPAAYHADRR